MVEHQPIGTEANVDSTADQPNIEFDNPMTDSNKNEGLIKTAMGALVGAVMGAIAVNVARQLTVENINKAVKGIGNAVKDAAEGINSTAKGVGIAVKSVAENATDTVKDVEETVKLQAEDLNANVKETIDVMRVTTQQVSANLVNTANVVKGTAQEVNTTVKGAVDIAYEDETSSTSQPTYVLVPVDNGKVVGQPIPIDIGAAIIPGKTDPSQE